jgi:hypothetical protein
MNSTSPSVRSVLPASALLILVGWGGLFLLMNTIAPTDWKPLWLFFFLAVMAVCGVREAIWLGIYFPTLAWLRIGRVLNPLLALLLALGFILIEGLLRFREHSQWKP